MLIWELPLIFKDHKNCLNSASGIRAILYNAFEKTEKANIHFGQNAIVFLLSGYKEIITPTQKIKLKAGEGFFIKKGNYLMTEKPLNEEPYESILLFFEDAITQKLTSELLKDSLFKETAFKDLIKIPASDQTLPFALSVKSYFGTCTQQQDLDLLLKIKLQELFWLLAHSDIRQNFVGFLAHLQKYQVHAIEDLVEKHFKENISLDQLAFLGGFSLSTFKRRFYEIYQVSPRKWLQERRLQEAHLLLQTTGQNVSEVCLEVGFENVSHFIQAFKDKYGFTPKQYKASYT